MSSLWWNYDEISIDVPLYLWSRELGPSGPFSQLPSHNFNKYNYKYNVECNLTYISEVNTILIKKYEYK